MTRRLATILMADDDADTSPPPGLILLDLDMPRVDGREALDASSCNSKPVSFGGLVKIITEVGRYWLEVVELPGRRS